MIQDRLEIELAGAGNGWTDITVDLAKDPVTLRYGIAGTGPQDRVAGTGQLEFSLNNAQTNSGGKGGYYSPAHVNCRAGWKIGCRIRWSILASTSGVRYYKFVGYLDEVIPAPGLYGERTVRCVAVDWMDHAARWPLEGIPVQIDKRGDEIFQAILANIPVQPMASQVGVGLDVFPFALDATEDEKVTALGEFQRLAQSELALIYMKGDTVQGGTLVYEPRSVRGATSLNVANFVDTQAMVGLDTRQARNLVLNKFQVTVHPKVVDENPTTVLYSLQTPSEVAPGSSLTLLGPYRDPNQKAQRVGGTAMVPPVAVTDYTMNTLADGTGVDVTANFTVTANFGGNGVRFTITNQGGASAYITKLQCRGKGIYDYGATVAEWADGDSQQNYGPGRAGVDMPYQNDPRVGLEAAQYLCNLYKNPLNQVQRADFYAGSADEALAENLLRREISDRIGITEQMTGLKTDVAGSETSEFGHFINQVEIVLDHLNNLSVAFILAPADATSYWLLEIPGSSELDVSTVLGYGLLLGHADVLHSDYHADVAHSDVAHADAAHADAAHADGEFNTPHSDSPHSDSHTDTAHVDVGHGDSAHVDSHSDVTHSDVAHQDTAHTDVAHQNVAYLDQVHLDSWYYDAEFGNNYTDIAHNDTPHSDTPHGDGAHIDSHTDVAHSDQHQDQAHSDVAHSDVLHSDVAHSDVLHSDVVHQDGHGDTGHVDTPHGDSSHQDVAHTDQHDDVEHGDT